MGKNFTFENILNNVSGFYMQFLYFIFWSLFIIQNFALSSNFSSSKKEELEIPLKLKISYLDPNRLWEVDKRNEKLYEYKLRADIFTLFGLKRDTAIAKIKSDIGSDRSINRYIGNAIINEKGAIFTAIFKSKKPSGPQLIDFANSLSNKKMYLDALIEKNYPIWLSHNVNPRKDVDLEDTFGLLTVLGRITKKNVYVYSKNEDPHEPDLRKLILVHRVVMINAQKQIPNVRALVNEDGSYSLLLEKADPAALHVIAKANEADAIKRDHLEASAAALSHNVSKESYAGIAEVVSSSSVNILEEDPKPKISRTSTLLKKDFKLKLARTNSEKSQDTLFDLPVERSLLKGNNAVIPPSVSLVDTQLKNVSLTTRLPNNEISAKYTKKSAAPKQDENLIAQKRNVINFINRKELTLSPYSREQSAAMAYQFLRRQIDDKPLTTNETLGYFLGIARLSLEFNYRPKNLTREQHIENLLTDLTKIIGDFANSENSTLRKFANYARIYAGRCLVVLARYDEAVRQFYCVKPNYTKAWQLDIAKLIIDGHYVPDLTLMSSEEWVLSLLNFKNLPGKSSNNNKRSFTAHKNEVNISNLARPHYVSGKIVKKQIRQARKWAQQNEVPPQIPPQLPSTRTRELKERIKNADLNLPSIRKSINEGMRNADLNRNNDQQGTQFAGIMRKKLKKYEYRESDRSFLVATKGPKRLSTFDDNNSHYKRQKNKAEIDDAGSDIEYQENNNIMVLENTEKPINPDVNTCNKYRHNNNFAIKNTDIVDGYEMERNIDDDETEIEINIDDDETEIEFKEAEDLPENIELNFYPEEESSYAKYQESITKGKLLKNGDEACLHLQNALAIAEELGDKVLMAEANIALADNQQLAKEKRITLYEKALQLLEGLDEPLQKAIAHIGLSYCKKDKKRNLQQRFNHCEEALKFSRESNNSVNSARAFMALGHTYFQNNHKDKALESFREALNILAATTDIISTAILQIEISELEKKTAGCEEALWKLEGTHHYEVIAKAHICIAKFSQDDTGKKIEHFREALKKLNGVYAPVTRTKAYIGLAKISPKQQRFELYKSALREIEPTDEVVYKAKVYITLAEATNAFDERNYSQKVLEITKDTDQHKVRARALISLGNLDVKDENHTDKKAWFLEAFDIQQKFLKTEASFEALIYLCLGDSEHEEKDKISWYKKALIILKSLKERKPRLEARALIGIGHSYNGLNLSGADYFNEALRLLRDYKVESTISYSKAFLGLIREALLATDNKHVDFITANKLLQEMKDNNLDAVFIEKAQRKIDGSKHYWNPNREKLVSILNHLHDHRINAHLNLEEARKLLDEMDNKTPGDAEIIKQARDKIENQEQFLDSPAGRFKLICQYLHHAEDWQASFKIAKDLLNGMKVEDQEDYSYFKRAEGRIKFSEIYYLLHKKPGNQKQNLAEAEILLQRMKDNNIDGEFIESAEELIKKKKNYLHNK